MSLNGKKEVRIDHKFSEALRVPPSSETEVNDGRLSKSQLSFNVGANAANSGSKEVPHPAIPSTHEGRDLGAYTTPELYRELISRLGEDPDRDGLLMTPERVEKSMSFLTRGYQEDAAGLLRGALFDVDYDEMVIVKDIEMYSLCEHHMLPFVGKVHVAYIPDGKVIGLSKIPRLIDVFARRLQVQERLTQQIAQSIQDAIAPLGVGVVIEARHLCMMMRGVEKQQSSTVTSSMVGVFRDQNTRTEFLSLVRGHSQGTI